MSDQQVIRPEQVLTETWTVTYSRAPWSHSDTQHTTARIDIPHRLVVISTGRGRTVDEARIDALIKQAAGYVQHQDDLEYAAVWINDETLEYLAQSVRQEQARRRRVAAAIPGAGS